MKRSNRSRFSRAMSVAMTTLLWFSATSYGDDNLQAVKLLAAIREGDVKIVRFLLRDPELANYWFHHGTTPLHEAAEHDQRSIVSVLIENKAELLRVDKNLETAQDRALQLGHNMVAAQIHLALPEEERFDNLMYVLDALVRNDASEHYPFFVEFLPEGRTIEYHEIDFFFQAASNGSVGMLGRFLSQGRNFDEQERLSRWTALHYFSAGGFLELIQKFYGDRSDIDVPDGSGQTPLSVAVASGHTPIVEYLAKRGADPNAADHDGNTPLHMAARWGRPTCVELLVQYGADAKRVNSSGLSPLDVALERGRHELVPVFPVDAPAKRFGVTPEDAHRIRLKNAVLASNVGQVQSLLSKSAAPIDSIDEQGQALIHYACTVGNPDLVRVLLAAGADANRIDALSGWSPLMMAVVGGHEEAVKVLLMSEANVNHQDVRGWSALHLAHFYGNDAIIQALSVSHPDLSLVNDDGETAEQVASQRATAVAQ